MTVIMVAIAVFATAIAVITVGLTEPPIVDGASQSLQASAQIEATRIETVLREARFAAFRVGGMSELRALVDGTPDADLNDKLAMTGPELASIALVDGSDIVVSTTEAPRIDPELIARPPTRSYGGMPIWMTPGGHACPSPCRSCANEETHTHSWRKWT